LNAKDPKEIASAAMMRGWLSIEAIWEIAKRADLGEDMTSLFSQWLSPQQLNAILHPDLNETIVPAQSSQTGKSSPMSTGRGPKVTTLPKLTPPERYSIAEELGQGGSGRVLSAVDQKLGRVVAFKVLKDSSNEEIKARFLQEARITACLEHPGIIPVYDVETPDSAAPFYVMRLVSHRSLHEILKQPPPRAEWSLARLCTIFVQVCRAVDYAHAHNVTHRDLKPENILLGEYGEVYVADWGIAKRASNKAKQHEPSNSISPAILRLSAALSMSESAQMTSGRSSTGSTKSGSLRTGSTKSGSTNSGTNSSSFDALTEDGVILGTVGYMAPEQIQGGDAVDFRADLFSLGVILYQILTGHKPFRQKTAKATLEATLHSEPIPPRTRFPACPFLLEELCLQLLSKNPEDRPISAGHVAKEVEDFLEGSKEKEKRREAALQLMERAAIFVSRYEELDEQRSLWLFEASEMKKQIKPWEPLEQKLPVWQLEAQAKEAYLEQAKAMTSACELYSQALILSPDVPGAREGLAALYVTRVFAAEEARDEASRIYYEALVFENDTKGKYRKMLQAEAQLNIKSNPPGALVTALRYEERDGILRPSHGKALGTTPLTFSLPPGNYLLRFSLNGYPDTQYPLVLRRGETYQANPRLYTRAEIGEGFQYVPAGSCTIGGDREAVSPLPRQEVSVKGFAIHKFPVTLREYLEFINDLQRTDPKQAKKRRPGELNSSEPWAIQDSSGRWIPSPRIIAGEGLLYCPQESYPDLPVTAIDWFDAVAYCKWRSQRDGCQYRLPTEVEYEKAARGTDERAFPWGSTFDPLFCKMIDSRQGFCQPEPIGAFVFDESPYGVRDLAGSMRSWIADIHEELDLETSLSEREIIEGASAVRIVRGGSWIHPIPPARSASRNPFLLTARYSQVGLRLVKPLPE
jgi:serine/threonine protein kinase/formylglycine-generating enzyme required for sulfatase activity